MLQKCVVIDWISEVIILLFFILYVFLHVKQANTQKYCKKYLYTYCLIQQQTLWQNSFIHPDEYMMHNKCIFLVYIYLAYIYILNHLNISKSFPTPKNFSMHFIIITIMLKLYINNKFLTPNNLSRLYSK